MTLPAGYTLDIPSWGVVNNTLPNLVGVDPIRATGDLVLALAGANPTSGDSRLSFSLPHDGVAHVIVFDLAGRTVRTLMNGRQSAGAHSLVWDGREDGGAMVPAGLYFVRADADGKHSTSRVVRMH
jgi:flagellar hook assembly protein FlgD